MDADPERGGSFRDSFSDMLDSNSDPLQEFTEMSPL